MELVTVDQKHHEVLTTPAKPVSLPLSQEVEDFIHAMYQFFDTLDNPAGLAAPQVGRPWQIILFHVPETAIGVRTGAENIHPLTLLINPDYQPIDSKGRFYGWEGCFSIPGKMGKVPRWWAIHYQGYDRAGNYITDTAEGFLARVIQHEVGHLRGELYRDLIDDPEVYGSIEAMQPLREKDKN